MRGRQQCAVDRLMFFECHYLIDYHLQLALLVVVRVAVLLYTLLECEYFFSLRYLAGMVDIPAVRLYIMLKCCPLGISFAIWFDLL